ncbi:hypothetical protein ACLOAV_006894 [Pseudogymnoascus australis]
MFFLRRYIWQMWTTFCHYFSLFSSGITGLSFPLISRERPKDDVESPSSQGEVERATAPLPMTTEPSDDATRQTPLSRFTPPELKPGEIAYTTKGTHIACGGSARLERLPSGDVVKTPLPDPDRRFYEAHCQDMRLEARICDAVGAHPRIPPRIPRIVSWDSETCCLTMEYLENGTLKDYIGSKSESLTPQLRQRWAKQASEGLSALHAAGIIHCDISPRNFLLDSDLHLKIADFGGHHSLARRPLPLLGHGSAILFLTGMRLLGLKKMYSVLAH